MTANLSHIRPEYQMVAFDAGLDVQAILVAWAQYTAWHEREHGEEPFRMFDWRRQVSFAVRDSEKLAKSLSDAAREARRVQLEAEARAVAAEEDYAKTAVSFDDWVKSLPGTHPMRLARARMPGAGPLTVIGAVAEEQAKAGKCACERCKTRAVVGDSGHVVRRRVNP